MTPFKLKTPIEQLRKRGLMISTPMYGGLATEQYLRSMLKFNWVAAENRLSVIHQFIPNESLITRARNMCCHTFMQSTAEHLLFIDADIGFEPEHVLALLDLQSDDSDFDVICASYPQKQIVWEQVAGAVRCGIPAAALAQYCCNHQFVPVERGPSGNAVFPLAKPVEVLQAGTGFMMIKRSVLEALQQAHPDWLYRDQTHNCDMVQFFQAALDQYDPRDDLESALRKIAAGIDPAGAREAARDALRKAKDEPARHFSTYLSEDFWFCRRVRELGMKIWICPWISLKHVGTHIFESPLAKQGDTIRLSVVGQA